MLDKDWDVPAQGTGFLIRLGFVLLAHDVALCDHREIFAQRAALGGGFLIRLGLVLLARDVALCDHREVFAQRAALGHGFLICLGVVVLLAYDLAVQKLREVWFFSSGLVFLAQELALCDHREALAQRAALGHGFLIRLGVVVLLAHELAVRKHRDVFSSLGGVLLAREPGLRYLGEVFAQCASFLLAPPRDNKQQNYVSWNL